VFYGTDSPQYFVRVLGKFPPRGGDYQLVPEWVLEGAADVKPEEEKGRHLGLDVARSGDDMTVAVVSCDGVVESARAWKLDDLMETAKRTMQVAEEWGVEGKNIHVDMDGLGAGVIDRMREAGVVVDPVDFGGKPRGDWNWLIGSDMKLLNRRAELHWVGRMGLLNAQFSVPREFKKTLWRQLGWTNYEYNERGYMKMESKDKIRARFGGSPDYADAWLVSLSRSRSGGRIFFI